MKYLAYCILPEEGPIGAVLPAGVEDAPVSLAAEGGLAAAFSLVPDGCRVPTVPRARAYARVVEALHAVSPVLPFRYGCFLESGPQLAALLRARRQEFQAALDAVDGCVEMGLRVMLEGSDRAVHPVSDSTEDLASGTAYLACRRSYYALKDRQEERAAAVAQDLRLALGGLFVKADVTHSRAGDGRLLSLCFLVPRDNVGLFRMTFQRIRQPEGRKMLLTGPWPPYSFAGGEKPGWLQGLRELDSAPRRESAP